MLLSVTTAPGSLAGPTIAGTPFHSTNWSPQMSVRMPQAIARLSEKEPWTALKNDCSKVFVGERKIREEKKQKRGIKIDNVLVEGDL